MLKLIGKSCKSIVVDAIKQYNDARVYTYNKDPIGTLEAYHVNSDECDIEEFCKFVLEDMRNISDSVDQLPLNMVVIYTNCSNAYDLRFLNDFGHMLEEENMVVTVVVCSR
jgi:hypothetical protein